MPVTQVNPTQATRAAGAISFTENSRVSSTLTDLASRAKRGGASSTSFLPAQGVRYDAYAFSYHTGRAKEMNLSQKPADGMVRGTIVINVSGHDGAERAAQYAKSNSYNVCITLPDGKQIRMNNIPRNNPGSAEYATKIPIEFPWQEGVARIEAWPTGSAGVGGYVEGRRYNVHMGDAHQYDVAKARTDAAEWERQHPNPSEYEASPRPYGDF
ncbi:MAG: hypothetical protein IT383_23940 [Deltaproteobacteria bacterium]|nr:hypothetical protein [Deltaproteobacteria bacterium]